MEGCSDDLLDAIDSGESPTIMGDGSEAFDFVAVEDCALANVKAMSANSADEFYNVGTGKRTSLKELAELIVELTECDKQIEYKPRSQATFVKNRIGCPKKAYTDLGFKADIDLKEGIKELIDWRNAHKEEVLARRMRSGK